MMLFHIETTNNADFPLRLAHSFLGPQTYFCLKSLLPIFIEEEPVSHMGMQEKTGTRMVSPSSGSSSPFALPLRSDKVGWR